MAGVLEQLRRRQKRSVEHCASTVTIRKAMELEAAREILAEVFGVRPSEVDEMIRNRSQSSEKKVTGEDHGQWPQEFRV
jgi:uncharacterized tellurite resistance protein B-like protein